jgi:hypothetical protein
MEDLCFCTVSSKARLAHVNVLAESLSTHHPGAQIFCLLVDSVENFLDQLSLKKNIVLIKTSTLKNVPNFTELFFKYNAFEATTALKPHFCEHLFKTYNMRKLVYLDSDVYVTAKMDEFNSLLEEFSIILTPHITKELPWDGFHPDEITFLKAGAFNTGSIGMANTQETLNFLSWWKNRLWFFGISNTEEGMFMDQKWIDLVPGLFDKVYILRNPGYNVAYWNLHERKFSFLKEKILVNGELLKFFHFSGFNPDDIEVISKHQTRHKLVYFLELRTLFELYKNLLVENGYNTVRQWPYSYNFFDNGGKIPDRARRVYWSLGDKAKKFGNPFSTGKKNTFWKYYTKTLPMRYRSLDRIIEFGKRYKKFLSKFPRLDMRARKFNMFLESWASSKAFNFFRGNRREG